MRISLVKYEKKKNNDPGSAHFFSRIDDSHCDRFQSDLTAVYRPPPGGSVVSLSDS